MSLGRNLIDAINASNSERIRQLITLPDEKTMAGAELDTVDEVNGKRYI